MQNEYYVTYEVQGFKSQKAGPYKSYEEAVLQADDIQGFEGVWDVAIVYASPDGLHSYCEDNGVEFCMDCGMTADKCVHPCPGCKMRIIK